MIPLTRFLRRRHYVLAPRQRALRAWWTATDSAESRQHGEGSNNRHVVTRTGFKHAMDWHQVEHTQRQGQDLWVHRQSPVPFSPHGGQYQYPDQQPVGIGNRAKQAISPAADVQAPLHAFVDTFAIVT